MSASALFLQAGAPGPKSMWQCCIPGHIDSEAMGTWGLPRDDRGGMVTQTKCRVYAAPPERLDDVDVEMLTTVVLPNSASLEAMIGEGLDGRHKHHPHGINGKCAGQLRRCQQGCH